MKTFESIVKDKRRKLTERIKLKKAHSQLDVPETPDKLKDLVADFTGGDKKRGNANKKPMRYKKEAKESQHIQAEREAITAQRLENEERKRLNKQERSTAARLLSSRTSKGQPKLKNVMKVLYSKLGINAKS